MKRNANILSASYLIFLLMITLSGSFGGGISDVIFYLGYLIPFAMVLLLSERERMSPPKIAMTGRGAALFLPTVIPTVLVIALLSLATSAIISLLGGVDTPVNLGDDLILALISHALIPSLLEEMLFRYLPIYTLAGYSRGYTLIFSSVFFALAHHSFFSIPYALFAGAVFMYLDLLCDNVLPSVILHFVNNAVSVIWTMYIPGRVGGAILFLILFILSLACAIPILKMRREYLNYVKKLLSDLKKPHVSYIMLITASTAIFFAVLELL